MNKSKYRLIEVKSEKDVKEFLGLPKKLIYKNDKNWICPLDSDMEKVFDPAKNTALQHGEAIRWILQDKKGKTIGRVAAFYNQKTIEEEEIRCGGLGFFECIDDREAAFCLFDKCKEWIEDKGLQGMDGPINLGNRNEWWGLLVEGFEPPIYAVPYNPSYYKKFFEDYGFELYYKQFSYKRSLENQDNVHPVVLKVAERLSNNKDYTFRHARKGELEKFMADFRLIYNKAWAKFNGVAPMTKKESEELLEELRPIIDERLLWLGYYKDEPISMFITFPDLNQILKSLNGKMNLWGKLKFLYYKKMNKFTIAVGTIFGVVPEFQRKGIEAALIMTFAQMVHQPKFNYKTLQMTWVGDFNPNMMKMVESIGGVVYKAHHTYRYLFDRNMPFERMKVVNKG